MTVLQELTDTEITSLADRVLGPELADLSFTGVRVEHRNIFDDGPSLIVGIQVGADVPAPFDPDRLHHLWRTLRDALSDEGDERFPHLIIEREGDEQPEPDHIPADP